MKDADGYLPVEPNPELVALFVMGFIRPEDHVLDVGCFQGEDAIYLHSAGCLAMGIDSSPTAVAYATGLARFHKAPHGQAQFRRGELPGCLRWFQRATFDVVSDRLIFSNLPDRAQARYLSEVRRVLKPDGLFVLRSGLKGATIDGYVRRSAVSSLVRAAGFREVRWSRTTAPREIRRTRGAQMYLSPARAGFCREAWFEVFERNTHFGK